MRRCLFAIVLLSALVSRAHAAAKSVTFLGVSGAGGDRFADLIERDLSDLYEVVSGDVYRSAAEQLGKRGASPEEVQAVATRLRIDAVVGGAIVGSGRSRYLLLAVRDGSTGLVVARGRYDLSGRTLPQIRERVTSDLVNALERVTRRPAGAPPLVVEAAPPVTEEPSLQSEADPTISIERHAARPIPTTEGQGLEAGVGFSVLTRSLSFDSAPAYSGGTVAGVRADGRVFPFALSAELAQAHPVLASLGLSGSYEHVFNFNSTVAGAQSAGHASRFAILFVGRIPLGHAARGGTLTVETGFQQLSWGHQSALDVRVPDVKYDLIDAGLGWDRPILGRWLALELRGAYLQPVTAGDIEADTQYGRSTGWGLEFDGGLTSRPARWLWLRVEARYSRVALNFAGAGTRFAHSSADQWASGAFEVGFAL